MWCTNSGKRLFDLFFLVFFLGWGQIWHYFLIFPNLPYLFWFVDVYQLFYLLTDLPGFTKTHGFFWVCQTHHILSGAFCHRWLRLLQMRRRGYQYLQSLVHKCSWRIKVRVKLENIYQSLKIVKFEKFPF